MSDAPGQPALYYPYVHIRSERWLKGTLLCVPSVKRIVPEDYTPEDIPAIVKYTRIEGPNGALLQAVPPYSSAAIEAQQRLLGMLRSHEKEILNRYQRAQAPIPDEYWIHYAKFNYELIEYLRDHQLAWPSRHSRAYGHREWYALHPTLGSAIMTTLGLSIARENGYDIVTPGVEFHEVLLGTQEEAVFDALLTNGTPTVFPSEAQIRNALGQLVISMTGINYQALRPEDIPELQASKHHRKFQELIWDTASRVRVHDDPEANREQLELRARQIIEAWHDTKTDLGKAIKDALFQAAVPLSADAVKAVFKGAETTDLVIAGSVAIVLLLHKGKRLLEERKRSSPFHYLTQVKETQDQALCLTFPLGLER
jgi:hypothetical protein